MEIVFIIDELLRQSLSDTTRNDLTDFRAQAANHTLTAEDEKYVRALYRRIMKHRRAEDVVASTNLNAESWKKEFDVALQAVETIDLEGRRKVARYVCETLSRVKTVPHRRELGVLNEIAMRATADRHKALAMGATDFTDPDWASAALIESWAGARIGALNKMMPVTVGIEIESELEQFLLKTLLFIECSQIERRAHISVISVVVNALLTSYIELHEAVFAHPLWQSIPIPGLFDAIDFNHHATQITEIERSLSEIRDRISTLCCDATLNEQDYLETAFQYVTTLLDAVTALAVIVTRLRRRADGETYTFSAYKDDVSAYERAEKAYHALGDEMNRKWRAYQGSF
jgi:hypothetical protein